MIGRSKKSTFAFIKDRIWKKINFWRGRSLSKAGKEMMIKSVLKYISAYIISIFIIPEAIVKDIEKCLIRYSGVKVIIIGEFSGWHGTKFLVIRRKEDWDFETLELLTWIWLLNRVGTGEKTASSSVKNLQSKVFP